jgi:hypothetical protein
MLSLQSAQRAQVLNDANQAARRVAAYAFARTG